MAKWKITLTTQVEKEIEAPENIDQEDLVKMTNELADNYENENNVKVIKIYGQRIRK